MFSMVLYSARADTGSASMETTSTEAASETEAGGSSSAGAGSVSASETGRAGAGAGVFQRQLVLWNSGSQTQRMAGMRMMLTSA